MMYVSPLEKMKGSGRAGWPSVVVVAATQPNGRPKWVSAQMAIR